MRASHEFKENTLSQTRAFLTCASVTFTEITAKSAEEGKSNIGKLMDLMRQQMAACKSPVYQELEFLEDMKSKSRNVRLPTAAHLNQNLKQLEALTKPLQALKDKDEA